MSTGMILILVGVVVGLLLNFWLGVALIVVGFGFILEGRRGGV